MLMDKNAFCPEIVRPGSPTDLMRGHCRGDRSWASYRLFDEETLQRHRDRDAQWAEKDLIKITGRVLMDIVCEVIAEVILPTTQELGTDAWEEAGDYFHRYRPNYPTCCGCGYVSGEEIEIEDEDSAEFFRSWTCSDFCATKKG